MLTHTWAEVRGLAQAHGAVTELRPLPRPLPAPRLGRGRPDMEGRCCLCFATLAPSAPVS